MFAFAGKAEIGPSTSNINECTSRAVLEPG